MKTQREMALNFALTLPQATADHPFEDDLDTTVFRHTEDGKWFGLLMRVGKRRLGLDTDGFVDVMNLKIDPEDSYTVRELYASILPAYHMNKRHWISVILDGSVPQDFCEMLIERSYDLTKRKMKKQIGREIE